MNAFETYNADFIEDQYGLWRKDPQSVSADWQHFFKGFDMGRAAGVDHAQVVAVEAREVGAVARGACLT